jgi:peptidoglycan hydrolase-like protein with peptidoglycan-binding domain
VSFVSCALAVTPALAAAGLGSRILKSGMQGNDVRTLQADLTDIGFITPTTGVFDATTKSRVTEFEAQYQLKANGIVTHTIVKKLLSVLASEQPTSGAGTTQPGVSDPTGAAGLGTTAPTGVPTTTTNPLETGTTTTPGPTGGSGLGAGPNSAPVGKATLDANGLALAPPGAPLAIEEIIEAADQIAFDPYVFGGGHASFKSSGYDCSGSVSFALHGGGLLSSPLDSTQFMSWGSKGKGRWITLWANGGHVYMQIAGLWFDTGAQSTANNNDRWSVTRVNTANGYVERHPTGW